MKNEFNPDYGDDPKVLKGALKDSLKAAGGLQNNLDKVLAENAQLVKETQRLAHELKARIRVARKWHHIADERKEMQAELDLHYGFAKYIADTAFTMMEGAGMPEFKNYELLANEARKMLPKEGE